MFDYQTVSADVALGDGMGVLVASREHTKGGNALAMNGGAISTSNVRFSTENRR